MMEDLIRMTGQAQEPLYLVYGQATLLDATVPVYNLIVIGASLAIALGIGWLLTRTSFGQHHARERRQPRDGRGARRRHARCH